MDKELAKQLEEIKKVQEDRKVIEEATASITELLNKLEV